MDTSAGLAELEAKFEQIGARVRVRPAARHGGGLGRSARRRVADPRLLALDVGRDPRGEFFDLAVPDGAELEILDTHPALRHLLLLARVDGEKARFLCGHDERHWFVAAIPESTPVTTVEAAQESLQPDEIRERTRTLARRSRVRGRTSAWVRQGEWFFVTATEFDPGPLDPVLRNEPITRSRGSVPHVAEEASRVGGVTVYLPTIPGRDLTRAQREDLARKYGRGITEPEMRRVARQNPTWRWTSMVRDPELYARGRVRHPDHATIRLRGWHRVLMSTESRARAMAHVAFLD
jgi:hypothetical protein